MNSDPFVDPGESFALDAYRVLPGSQPSPSLDARILAAAHAANARASASRRRWMPALATAAAAVFAVSLAWRGMDTPIPNLPETGEPAAPRMQPAFKTENAPQHRSQRAGRRESEQRDGEPPGIANTAPTLSSADWEASDSAKAKRSDAPAMTQYSKVAAQPPTSPGEASQALAGQGAVPASPPLGADTPTSDRRREEAAFAADPAELDAAAASPAVASQAGIGLDPAVEDSVSVDSVHAGTTSLQEAVAAARAARARGDFVRAQTLADVISTKFGKENLPPDLRNSSAE